MISVLSINVISSYVSQGRNCEYTQHHIFHICRTSCSYVSILDEQINFSCVYRIYHTSHTGIFLPHLLRSPRCSCKPYVQYVPQISSNFQMIHHTSCMQEIVLLHSEGHQNLSYEHYEPSSCVHRDYPCA